MDVINVFLYGDFEEDVYMYLFLGYRGSGMLIIFSKGEPFFKGKRNKVFLVCKLDKFLYGFK